MGIFAHLGSPISCVIVWAFLGVTPPIVVLSFVGVAMIFTTFILVMEKTVAGVALPPFTVRQLVGGMAMIFLKGVAVGGAVVTAGWWLLSFISPYDQHRNSWWLIVGATVLTDAGYYWTHRLLSHGRGSHPILKCYRKAHAVHHGVRELDFLRGNESSLVDTAVSQFQPSLIVVSYLLGMDLGSTWAAYVLILTLQATDHTSVTYDIGWLRYVFMDNHAHKLHHCKHGARFNHGAAFSVFDRLWGTYLEDWTVRANYLHHHRLAIPRERDAGCRLRWRRPTVPSVEPVPPGDQVAELLGERRLGPHLARGRSEADVGVGHRPHHL